MRRVLALAALLAACRTTLDQEPLTDGGAVPGVVADLALADAVCLPPDRDAAVGNCPCGAAGLCLPATGRLSVQTQSAASVLRLEVMDDNGCRRTVVSTDPPVGVPRWAPDRERLAYLTARFQSPRLHVLRVAASGQVTCRADFPLGDLRVTELAWGGERDLWLFGAAVVARFRLGEGVLDRVTLAASRHDAVGDGPLVVVDDRCAGAPCSRIATRRSVLNGELVEVVREPRAIGPVRLSPDGAWLVYELDGFVIAPVVRGERSAPLGRPGDRSPAFAWDGRAIVYTTDDGQLRYHVMIGPDAGRQLTIPPTWKGVFSPDWSPPPRSCAAASTCL